MLRTILFCLSLFVLSGCGIFESKENIAPPPQKPIVKPSVPLQIIENNKEDLKQIKEKLADDIELGSKTRVLEKKHPTDDLAFGTAVRTFVQKQENKNISSAEKKHSSLIAELINEYPAVLSAALIIVACVLIALCCVLYFIVRIFFRPKEKRRKE